MTLPTESRLREAVRMLLAVLFVAAGMLHFVLPKAYEAIIPPGLPSPRALVLISGIAEVAGGIGLMVSPLRRLAAWGLIALLIAVFPANVYVAASPERFAHLPLPAWALWARLPLQFVLVTAVWWSALRGPRSAAGEAAR